MTAVQHTLKDSYRYPLLDPKSKQQRKFLSIQDEDLETFFQLNATFI